MNETTEAAHLPLFVSDNGNALLMLPIERLQDHPENPRIALLESVIEDIAAQLREKGFGLSHALRVRPFGDDYQIIAGHHRKRAALLAGISEVPCWVEDLDDDEAYMQLLLDNAEEGFSALEYGIHAYRYVQRGTPGRGNEGGISEYARKINKTKQYIGELRQAAEVYDAIPEKVSSSLPFRDKAKHLASIHNAPSDTWLSLITAMFVPEKSWSVEETEKAVKRVKALCEAIPTWWSQLDRSGLVTMACEGNAAPQTTMFKEAAKIDAGLKPATLYRYEATDITEIRSDGREWRKWETTAYLYDTSAIFRQRVQEEMTLPTAQRLRDIEKNLLQHIALLSQSGEQWRPVLTDEEYIEEQGRVRALERLSKREHYTPQLIYADILDGFRQIGTESIDLICTDPPYNMDKADWDTIPDYGAWVESWLKQCYRVLKPSGCIYIFQRQNLAIAQTIIALETIGFYSLADPPLDRDCVQGTGAGPYGGNRETILFYAKTDNPYINADVLEVEREEQDKRAYRGQTYDTKKIGGILRFPALDEKDPERVDFPTQKPVALLELLIKASCPEGGRVLDCFIGSGSTGVAAMRLERRSIGIDQSRDTLNLAQGRFEQTEVGAAL